LLAGIGLPVILQGGQKPDFSAVPGVVIAHSPASSGQDLGSPGILILPDGGYLSKHDFFGPGSALTVPGF